MHQDGHPKKEAFSRYLKFRRYLKLRVKMVSLNPGIHIWFFLNVMLSFYLGHLKLRTLILNFIFTQ